MTTKSTLTRRSALLLAALLWLAPLASSAACAWADAVGGPEVADFTLANGLEVVVIPDHRTPVVTHMVWYKVGSADETPGRSGLAHFLEHLMFKGTAKNPEGKFSQTVAALGGQENAFTTADFTAFFQRIAREHLGQMMAFEADRMTGLVLSDANVIPELKVVLEEYNMRMANSPEARLGAQINAALYVNNPYGRPVIGWHHEIEALTRADALAFYHRFYTPNNAVVVIAGDVTADEVKALAEKTYAKVPRVAEPPPRSRPQEPQPAGPRTVMLADPRVAQPSLQRSYLVPSYAKSRKDAAALEVLAHVLGSGLTSRLYRALVIDAHLAVNAGGFYQGSALDDSALGVFAMPQPGVAFPAIEAAINDVIAELIKNGVGTDELERAKTHMIAQAVYAQDNQAALARWYGTALCTGLTVKDVQAWPDLIRSVTAEQVRAAARTWLDARRSVTGYLVKELPQEKHS
ncbi:MAG TPA: pitrilysin family protein [Xanthobacteraceae bacterium]|nr:pitrilysin family protein [Xanthobacteraceae bacterium]